MADKRVIRMDFVDEEAVLRTLEAAVAATSSQNDWARKHSLSQSYVSQVLARRTRPGSSILIPLGYRKVTLYERIKP